MCFMMISESVRDPFRELVVGAEDNDLQELAELAKEAATIAFQVI